jgi:PAS domain S-box-containing protein
MPKEIADLQDHQKRVQWLSTQVANPTPYAERIRYIYSPPEAICNDEIELINGTYLDRYTAPVRGKDGTYYGRIWSTHDITKRKLAEQQLVWKTALPEAQLNSTLDGIIGVDGEGQLALQHAGRILFVNQPLLELWGITLEEAVGKNFTDLGYPSDLAAKLDRHLQEVFETKQELKDEKAYTSPIGNDGYYEYIFSPAFELDSKVDFVVGSTRDVTERKLAEKSARHLASIVESSDDAIIGKELNSIVTSWNRGAEKVIPRILETNPELFETYVRIASTGTTEQVETHVIPLGFWFSISVYSHQTDHFTAVFENITERKRSEGRMRQLVDSNVQGVLFWKRNGGITSANDAFLRLVHHTRDDLEKGRINWMALTPPEYAHLDRRALEEIAATGVSAPYEKEFLRQDGSRVPVLLGSASFEDNPDEGVCYIVDLTERKKLENQFLRAQRMESIGTFAGGIAHDRNNILAPIMMSIHVLKATNEDPETMDVLETIEQSAKRGADIVRQVLSFARGVEGERIEIQPNHLLKELQSIIKDTFPKNIRFQFAIPDDTWSIVGDPTQVHQILLNLCVNARDAMPDGGKLTVGVENCVLDEHYSMMPVEAKPGRYVKLNVTDSGTGMPPALIDKIFEPFFTTKELNKGTGLGLSTVMAIVKGHEGIINVYSEQGKGTRFTVYLPVSTTMAQPQMKESEGVGLPQGAGETILIVDDEASIIKITQRTLRSSGYKVLTATDGADALAVYLQNRKTSPSFSPT